MNNKFTNLNRKSVLIVFLYFLSFLLLIVVLPMFIIGNGKNVKDKVNDNKLSVVQRDKEDKGSKVRVYISKKDKIVELDIEEYVKGVVASEMPANFNIEALKAQAVASRNFTLNKMKCKCSNAKGADICDDVHCQVYTGKEDKIKEWGNSGHKNWAQIEAAVNSTKGQYMYYKGERILNAQYFAVSWGKTEESKEVFGQEQPYLQSVESLGDSLAPKYITTTNIDNNIFVNKINNKYKNSKVKTNNISSRVNILSRNESGSVKFIKIGDNKISGVDFRNLFDLNSTNFNIIFNKGYVTVKCIGYGHGVGMSQWGANYMASRGSDYKQILKHYYKGIEIK